MSYWPIIGIATLSVLGGCSALRTGKFGKHQVILECQEQGETIDLVKLKTEPWYNRWSFTHDHQKQPVKLVHEKFNSKLEKSNVYFDSANKERQSDWYVGWSLKPVQIIRLDEGNEIDITRNAIRHEKKAYDRAQLESSV